MPDPWYCYSDQPPPLTVRVRVMWGARGFIGARAKHPTTGDERWAEFRPGSDQPRPVLLKGTPDLWQPLNPQAWSLPLPAPVTPAEAGRMTTERTRFALVEESEAADLAREMEADRAAAQASRDEPRGRQAVEIGWWRDWSQIQYEKAPNISLRMVEGRLMRAVACCEAKRVDVLRISPLLGDFDDAFVRALADIEATTPTDIVPKFQPLPADNDDFLTAMSWFGALYPPEARPPHWHKLDGLARFNRAQKILIWRSLNVPPSFAEIGRLLSVKGQRVSQLLEQAIKDCWRFANGLPPRKGLAKRVDHMAKVRETNRRAKASGD